MKKLKMAVIGVGHLGKEHARILSSLSQVDLVGLVDINISRAREIGEQYKVKGYQNLDEIIGEIDAASVVVPTDKHYQITGKLLAAGKNILVEKPITTTLEQAERLVTLADEKGLLLQVGHVERFNPIIQDLARLVQQPRFIEIHRLSPFTPRGTEVGVVLDLMIHDIDIVLAIVKERIEKIDAVGVDVLTPFEDIANARITFRNGCVANLTASRVSPERMRKIRVFEPNVYTSVDYYQQEGVCYYKEGNKILKRTMKVGKDEPLKLELEDFIRSVLENKQPQVSGEDAVAVLEAAEKIRTEIWKARAC